MSDGAETLPVGHGNASAERFAIGSVAAGRYRIERFIAAGGMGEVYAARDQVVDADVALKTLRPELASSADAVARLRREIALARTVTNRHICRLHDVGEHDGRVFLTMELLDGRTLAELVKAGPLAIDEVERIARQLVAGISALHRASIIHRDFKTANVIVVGEGSESRAVITDFGLARSITSDDQRLTLESSLLGTPAYMAPEQVEARPATTATDIYSLGVVLFELLTGKLPFDEDTAMATATARLSKDPPKPSSLRGEIPARWDAIVLRCLQRDPTLRFASAEDVLGYRPRSRRWFLAAGGAGAAAAAVGLWRLRGCVDEPAQSPATDETIALLPVVGEGDWRADPWRFAITVDLRDALSTAGVPMFGIQNDGMRPGFGGPVQRLLAQPDPVAAALAVKRVTTAISLAVERSASEVVLVVTLTGAVSWSPRRFARKPDEIALLVEDVAIAIAAALGYGMPRRALDSPLIDAALYERYGGALVFYTRERSEEEWKEIDADRQPPPPWQLNQLVKQVPALVRASGLAAAIQQATGEQQETAEDSQGFYDRADAILDRALAIDPGNAYAHAVRGHVAMLRYDWNSADAETALATKLAPTHDRVGYHRGFMLFLSGRFDEGIAHAEQRLERNDPEASRAKLTWQYQRARRYAEIIRYTEPKLTKPGSTKFQGEGIVGLARTYAELARYDDALKVAERARPHVDNEALANLVPVYVMAGKVDEARAIRDKIPTDGPGRVSLAGQAMMADALGETDKALELLERVVEAHNVFALFIKVERYSPALRAESRFQALIAKVGFPP